MTSPEKFSSLDSIKTIHSITFVHIRIKITRTVEKEVADSKMNKPVRRLYELLKTDLILNISIHDCIVLFSEEMLKNLNHLDSL